MRGTRYAGRAACGLLAVALVAGVAHARQDFSAQDPTGTVAVEGSAARAGDSERVELRAAVRPDASPPAVAPEQGDGEAPIGPPDLGAGAHLPDLAPIPAWGIYIDESVVGTSAGDYVLATAQGQDPFGGSRPAIRFGVTIANRGRHSLEMIGVPTPNTEAEEGARVEGYQCVRFAGPRVDGSGRVCQQYQPAGTMSLHAQHGHFHIDGFARYRLLRDVNGAPDRRAAGVVTTAEKVGFCMGDTTWMRAEPMTVDTGWYRECRHTTPNVPVTFRQGVTPGWADTYGPDLPGQHLLLDKVVDGIYWIEVAINPPDPSRTVTIRETRLDNNVSYQRIRVSGNRTKVEAI